jgi:hypothetical protein
MISLARGAGESEDVDELTRSATPTAEDPIVEGGRLSAFVRAARQRMNVHALIFVVAIVSTLHVLWSLLGGAYEADDIWAALLPGELWTKHESFWTFMVAQNKFWIDADGRFFPMSVFEGTLSLIVFDSRYSYKIFQMSVVLVDIGLLYLVVEKLVRQRWTAALVTIIVITTFDFRIGFDAIQQFTGQQGLLEAAFLLTFLFVIAYLDSGKLMWLVPIFVFWAITLTTYETSFLMLPAIWLLIWHRRPGRKRAIAAFIATIIPTLIVGGIIVRIRQLVPVPASTSYIAKFSPGPVITTFAKQSASVLPFSQYYMNSTRDLSNYLSAPLPLSFFTVILGISAAIAICVCSVRQRLSRRDVVLLAGVGLILLAAPAAVVAVTWTWQGQVTWGLPYIPVYDEGFGLAFLIAVAVAVVAKGIRSIRVPGARTAVATVAVMVFSVSSSYGILGVAGNNIRVVDNRDSGLGWLEQQPQLGWGRQIAADAEHAGLFPITRNIVDVAALTPTAWLESSEVSFRENAHVAIVNAFPVPTLSGSAATQVPGCPLAAAPCKPSPKYSLLVYLQGTSYTTGIGVIGTFRSAQSRSSSPDDVTAVLASPKIFVEDPAINGSTNVKLCVVGGAPNNVVRGLRTLSLGDHSRMLEGGPSVTVTPEALGLVVGRECSPL